MLMLVGLHNILPLNFLVFGFYQHSIPTLTKTAQADRAGETQSGKCHATHSAQRKDKAQTQKTDVLLLLTLILPYSELISY